MPLFGIEVSNRNGNINYKAAKSAGVRFAMVKATEGCEECTRHSTDSRFSQNIEGFHSVGIPVGAYHVFRAKTLSETYKEAEHFLNTIKSHRDKIILAPVCVVGADTELTSNQQINLAHVFLSRVSSVCGSAYISVGGTDTFCDDKLVMRTHTRNGQLVGVVGEFACSFAFEDITRRIIKSRTDITDDVLDYILTYESGENILARLANMLVAKMINPLKNPSYERIVPLLRLCCGLTHEECIHLCKHALSEELMRELYVGMVR